VTIGNGFTPGVPEITASALALPVSGGAIRGIGETFGTDPITGTASMTVPVATARFTTSVPSGQPATAPLALTLREEHYPYWASLAAGRVVRSVELFASAGSGDVTVYDAPADNPPGTRHETVLRADQSVGDLRSGMLAAPLPSAIGELTLYIDHPTLTDLWIVLVWGAAAPTIS